MNAPARCADIEQALSAYVDHEANQQEIALVDAHVQHCADCARRLRDYGRLALTVDRKLQELTQEAPTHVARRPRGATRQARPPVLSILILARLAAVAVLLIVGAFVVLTLVQTRDEAASLVTASSHPAEPRAARPPVIVLRLTSVLDPSEASYVERAISAADAEHAQAVVLVLQTDGGLNGAVARVQHAVADSGVPVIAYVARDTRMDATVTAVADSAALRATAADSSSTNQADLEAPDVASLLTQLDGRQVPTAAGSVTLQTRDAAPEQFAMQPFELLAHRFIDPTTAYLLFVLGLFAVLVEIAHPGSLVPAVAGVVSLLLALAAFSVLPINLVGAALIVGAVALIAVDVQVFGHGALTLLGVACPVIGSFVLYVQWGSSASPFTADIAVALPVLAGVASVGLLLGLALVRVAHDVRIRPPVAVMQSLVGARGVARTALAPDGVVHVNGQLWSARVRGGKLTAGDPVRVLGRNGLVLEVESTARLGAATQKGVPR